MFGRRTETRRTQAYQVRQQAAEQHPGYDQPEQVTNGEEGQYRTPSPSGPLSYIANYSKGLPHNRAGEVRPEAYRALLPRRTGPSSVRSTARTRTTSSRSRSASRPAAA
jgi:hypothetical protein